MATRPVFIPLCAGPALVKTQFIDFGWVSGRDISIIQANVDSLHNETEKINLGIKNTLEVSTKSKKAIGCALSAFNLKYFSQQTQTEYPVECIYQASKVFGDNGPFKDLLKVSPASAKKDERLSSHGRLTHFMSNGVVWQTEPLTAFYDWIYINALWANQSLADKAVLYDAFTDIEFNPKRSMNCQAYSAALYTALFQRGLLQKALTSRESFLGLTGEFEISNSREDELSQPRLI